MSGRWRVVVTRLAAEQLAAVADVRVRQLLAERIDELAENPQLQGKPLIDELAGYRSLRAVGQRYRIIYRATTSTVTVYVVTLGRRQAGSRTDVYALARRLAQRGRLNPAASEDDSEQSDNE